MKMRKLIAAFSAIFAAGMSFAGTICTCTTSPVAVDTVGNPIVDSLQVSYDAAWIGGDANAMVVIADNGTEVKRTTGAGDFTHTLTGDGRHELTYTTYIGGVAQDEVYTATVFKNWTSNISDVTAKQRYPWNGKVDITYTLTGDVMAGLPAWNMPRLFVTASNRVDGTTYTAAASALSGDTGTAEGAHHVVWDMDAQGLKIKSDEVAFTVSYQIYDQYCVIDLSGGASASSYPVSYVSSVPSGGFNTDEYKTTKLVLRLIEPGTFMMGGSYQVTLTKPFYCGVFEVTQKQYELVTGSNPSSYKGDMRPVEQVSWNTIRGNSSTYNWPGSENVDSNTFVGRLQARTGLNFDLPTEAQWEYACRAGTTSKYNNGGDTENDLKLLGRYSGNKSDGKGGYSQHTKVGSYLPNAWGLYDMSGNAWEWCLDWDGSLTSGVTDPSGSSSGSYRVGRGGSWNHDAFFCTSSLRAVSNPSSENGNDGFRLVRTLSSANGERSPEAVAGAERADVLCAAEAAPVAIDSRVDVEPVLDSVVVAWDAAWIGGDANATVVIADNGTEVKRTTGAGEFTHTLTGGGRHEMTYTTYIDGVAQDEVYTATFLMPRPDAPVILPESGRVFEGSLTVTISCETEGATIYYTTDGSEPTKDSTAYKRFKIYGKATVKAIAYDAARDRYSDVTTAEYALGSCANPVIAPAGGSAVAAAGGYVFYRDGQSVTISRNGEEGTIRYTLDGTDPTAASAVYSGPITLDVTTTVKAKVFSDSYFDSETVTVAFTREWEQVATPEIAVASTFTGSRTMCEIACSTEGARIFYTLNGNAPTSHSTRYAGAFYITGSCTVKAIALLSGCLDSEVAVKTIIKEWGIGDTMGAPDLAFTTSGDGDKAFYRVADASAPNGEAMHSGDIGNSSAYGLFARTVLSTTVTGPGTASFSWKASCEDDAPDYEWDHGEFAVDGVVRAYVSGETGWTNVSVSVTGSGKHTLTWTYLKDDAAAEGEDCIWVGGFGWESAEPYTHTTEVPVPYAWLRAHDPGVADEYEAYEAAAKATAANGRLSVVECYVVGLDPEIATNDFKIISFPMKADGTPDFSNVAFDPPQAQWNVPDAPVTWKGAATLEGPWRTVTEEVGRGVSPSRGGSPGTARPTLQFFKAVVFGDADDDLGGVQLWEGGPYWAECNVGASRPEEYGYYFWWGDTVGYTRNGGTWNDYGYGDGSGYYYGVTWVSSTGQQMSSSPFASCPTDDKDNSALQSAGYIDSTGNLTAAHDAATAHLGAPWRMPTDAEISALINNCTTTWITINGVPGRLVTGKGAYADRSIFLPAAGYGNDSYLYSPGSYGFYWSSTPYSDYSYGAWSLDFSSGYFYRSNGSRYIGQSVRPVRGFAE